jgi:MFS family permease
MVVYPALGLGGVLMVATINSYLQTTIDDEYRGRVMAIFSTLMIGATPFGSPLVGWVAATYGPRWSIGVAAFGGLLAVLIALVWMRSQHNIGAVDTLRSAFTTTPVPGNETATQLITITERGP